jgi:drug/metabolite transporter (DMT)-like permease
MENPLANRLIFNLYLSGAFHVWNEIYRCRRCFIDDNFQPDFYSINSHSFSRVGSGLVIALIGVFILFFYSPNIDIPFADRLTGNFLIAAAALAWAFSTILIKKSMTTSKNPLSPLHLTVWSSVMGLLILTPWAGYEMLTLGLTNPELDVWVAIVFLAFFSTVLSYVWFADGIKILGAGKTALYVYLVPPFGIISAWIMIDEKIGWSFLLSFVLIVIGVALAQSEKRDEQDASGH